MSDNIPIAKPDLGEEEAAAARQAILSGWVTQGPQVAEFEREFASLVGARHAVAVSNCTVALHLALKGAGVTAGSEVLVPSHSFIATANAVAYLEAVPVFVDIDPETGNIDPQKTRELINSKTSAILIVHQVGMPCDMTAFMKLAQETGLPLIEDAACAIGSEVQVEGRWDKVGRPHGQVACFSFHPRKILTTGDGGMLTTNDPELDRQYRLWRHHGMSVSDKERHGSSKVVFEEYVEVAYNYRMTDIQAAVGRCQLQRLPGILSRRRELAQRYHQLLANLPGLAPPCEPGYARSNWQTYLVQLDSQLDQRTVMQQLLDRGISTRRGIMCAHREPAYANRQWRCAGEANCGCPPSSCQSLKQSEQAQDHRLALPLFTTMTEAQQDRVVSALQEILGGLYAHS